MVSSVNSSQHSVTQTPLYRYSPCFLQVATALCTFLSACLGRVPDALVRSKFANCSQVLLAVLERQQEQVLHKPCLKCIRTADAFD